MKNAVVFLVGVLLAVALAEEVKECPRRVSLECPKVSPLSPMYLPYPKDCSKFCQCSNGVAYEHDCPPGLYFDDNLDVCNYPDKVSSVTSIYTRSFL